LKWLIDIDSAPTMQKEFDELTLKQEYTYEDQALFAKHLWRMQLLISVPDGEVV